MSEQITEQVRPGYTAVAAGSPSGDHAGVRAIAQAFGYTAAELVSVPAASACCPSARAGVPGRGPGG
jgi:hypothetical protein